MSTQLADAVARAIETCRPSHIHIAQARGARLEVLQGSRGWCRVYGCIGDDQQGCAIVWNGLVQSASAIEGVREIDWQGVPIATANTSEEATYVQPINPARAALRHHVTGAIERGEAEPITEVL